ncbi:MAG: hypothetical protein ABGX31_01110 [bacterium]
MTQIIGFAGKKQSGKNTSCNFVMMMKMRERGISKAIRINENTGELEVQEVFDQSVPGMEWFPFREPYVNLEGVYQSVGPFCKIYALADSLKGIAINVLGLPEDKVYGTDEDKQTKTHLLWENMPGVITPEIERAIFKRAQGNIDPALLGLIVHAAGQMTIRDVLQHMGTEIFRKMYETVWFDTMMRRIEEDKPEIALVCDARFDNELILLKESGAIVIGLRRDIFQSKDTHSSEQINFDLCSTVLENGELTIDEQCEAIYVTLCDFKCKNIPKMIVRA